MLLTKRQWEILANALDNYDYRQEREDGPVTRDEVEALKAGLDPRGEYKPEEPVLIMLVVGSSYDHYYAVPTRVVKEVVGEGKGVTSAEDFRKKVTALLDGAVPCEVHTNAEEDVSLVNDGDGPEEAWDDFLDTLAYVAGFEYLEARS